MRKYKNLFIIAISNCPNLFMTACSTEDSSNLKMKVESLDEMLKISFH